MYTREAKVTRHLDDLTYDLSQHGNNLRECVEDVFWGLRTNTVYPSDDDIITDDIDATIKDMMRSERWAAQTLDRFDRVLGRIITARRKLGDVVINGYTFTATE